LALLNLSQIRAIPASIIWFTGRHPKSLPPMWSTEREIASGDLVIVWLVRVRLQATNLSTLGLLRQDLTPHRF
jgi:hypothetical protein